MKAWIWKRCSFDAAHTLPLHKGKCSRLHGHTYFVELGIECEVDATTGMGIDMGDLAAFLYGGVVCLFDHSNLNDKMPGVQPTAENIAKVILDAAEKHFELLALMKIRVFETPDSWVEVERVG